MTQQIQKETRMDKLAIVVFKNLFISRTVFQSSVLLIVTIDLMLRDKLLFEKC